MTDRIDLGGGAYLEPDTGPRNSPFHKTIVTAVMIPNTRTGMMLTLECGHRVQSFGNLIHSGGVILCVACRDQQADAKT